MQDPIIAVGAGMPVVFIDADQTQVVMTDSTGQASATVLAGASVTAIVSPGHGGDARLETVLATAPGDDLTLGDRAFDTSADGTFTVNFPSSSAPARVSNPCDVSLPGGSPAILRMRKDCEQNPIEILLDGVGGYVDAMVPFVSGGNTTITAQPTPDVQLTMSYNDIPSAVVRLNGNWVTGGSAWGGPTAQPPTDPLTVTVNVPVGLDVTVETNVFDAATALQTVDLAQTPSTASVSIDLGGNLLPWLQTPTIDLQAGTISAPSLEDGITGGDADLFYIDFAYGGRNATDPSAPQGIEWTLFAPAAGNLTLPVLPPAAGDLQPADGTMAFVNDEQLIESSDVDSYAIARRSPHTYLVPTPGAARRRISKKPAM